MTQPRRWLAAVAVLCQGTTIPVVNSWTTKSTSVVPRIAASDFDAERYYSQQRPKPLLIANALEECEVCCDILMAVAQRGELGVDLQCQISSDASTELYEDVDLPEALEDILFESDSQVAYLSFCEGLLEEHEDLQPIAEKATFSRERLFNNDTEWFAHYFPAAWQPCDAVVFAGAGATSTLHRDPFEWTGTSLCLEGSKVWRFIDPEADVRTVDAALNSYRLDSIAWEGKSRSAGWQSDYSLYRTRQHDKIPTGRAWSEMEDDDDGGGLRKADEMLRIGSSTEILTPDEIDADLAIATAIQQPGDLLLIPARWWHQTYALEPSVAIASQRCGHHDSTLVLQHILDHHEVDSITAKAILAASDKRPERVVEALLSVVS